MEWLLDPGIWMSLLTLTTLEIVLGIDNVVFVSILSTKLLAHQQKTAIATRFRDWDEEAPP